MQQNMIVGNSLSFSGLIERIKDLQNKINGNTSYIPIFIFY